MRALYKYPHAAFPYQDLIETNRRRSRTRIRIRTDRHRHLRRERLFRRRSRVRQRAVPKTSSFAYTRPIAARTRTRCTLLPTLWFRNEWSWRERDRALLDRAAPPRARRSTRASRIKRISATTGSTPKMPTSCSSPRMRRTSSSSTACPIAQPRVKDGVERLPGARRGERGRYRYAGTKCSAHYALSARAAARHRTIELRLSNAPHDPPFGDRTSMTAFATRSRRGRRLLRRDQSVSLRRRRRVACSAKRSPDCCGPSNSTTTICRAGSMAIRFSRRRRPNACTDATTTGSTSTRPRSCRCRTSGSIRGSQRGISPSTPLPLR